MNDAAVIDVQKELSDLNIEYAKSKTAYELALSKIKSTTEKVDILLQERANSYKGFVGASIKEYILEDPISSSNSDSTKETTGIQQQASATVAKVQVQASDAIQNASIAVGNVSSAVASSAKTASKSIGRRLSSKINCYFYYYNIYNNNNFFKINLVGTKFGMGFLQKARASFTQESPDREDGEEEGEEEVADSTVDDSTELEITDNATIKEDQDVSHMETSEP
jgi:hypothetical protein